MGSPLFQVTLKLMDQLCATVTCLVASTTVVILATTYASGKSGGSMGSKRPVLPDLNFAPEGRRTRSELAHAVPLAKHSMNPMPKLSSTRQTPVQYKTAPAFSVRSPSGKLHDTPDSRHLIKKNPLLESQRTELNLARSQMGEKFNTVGLVPEVIHDYNGGYGGQYNGLPNPNGVKCYASSVLQCMVTCEPFTAALRSCRDDSDPVLRSLKTLLSILRDPSVSKQPLYDAYRNFLAAIDKAMPGSDFGLKNTEQQDAHEFYATALMPYLRDKCYEAFEKVMGLGRYIDRKRLQYQDSRRNISPDISTDDVISIAWAESLQTALDAEFVNDEDSSESGNDKVTRTKVITSAPSLLVVHIKRFEVSNDIPMKISKSMLMQRFVTIKHGDGSEAAQYYLSAYVDHIRGSLKSGHYVAVVPDETRADYNKTTIIDDEDISVNNDGTSSGSYMVFLTQVQ